MNSGRAASRPRFPLQSPLRSISTAIALASAGCARSALRLAKTGRQALASIANRGARRTARGGRASPKLLSSPLDGASSHTCSLRQPRPKGGVLRFAPFRPELAGQRRPGAPRTGGARDRGSALAALACAPAPLAHTARPCPAAPVAPLRARCANEPSSGADTLRWAQGHSALHSIRASETHHVRHRHSRLSGAVSDRDRFARTRSSSAQPPSAASSTPATSGTATTRSARWARRSASSPKGVAPDGTSSPTSARACCGDS